MLDSFVRRSFYNCSRRIQRAHYPLNSSRFGHRDTLVRFSKVSHTSKSNNWRKNYLFFIKIRNCFFLSFSSLFFSQGKPRTTTTHKRKQCEVRSLSLSLSLICLCICARLCARNTLSYETCYTFLSRGVREWRLFFSFIIAFARAFRVVLSRKKWEKREKSYALFVSSLRNGKRENVRWKRNEDRQVAILKLRVTMARFVFYQARVAV